MDTVKGRSGALAFAGADSQSWHVCATAVVPDNEKVKASMADMSVPTFIVLNLILNFQYVLNCSMIAARAYPIAE
jgi:hypothetical protein